MNRPSERYLRLADSRSLDVLLCLFHKKDDEWMIYTTLDQVASECNVTKVTVNRVFQKLYAEQWLVKIKNGQYKFQYPPTR